MEPIDATMTISADRWLMWSEQWNPIVGPPPNETMPHINTSTDVLCKNCISNYDTMACIRSIALCTLSAITAILCGLRIIRLHTLPSPCYHRLILFYVLLMHALLGTVEWALGWTSQAALVSVYLRSLELLIICHYYLTIACRVMHWTSEVTSRLSVLGLTFMYFYFTLFVVVGLVFAIGPWRDCYAPYWIWLSAGNLMTVQLIVWSFVLLGRRINAVSATESLKREQKCQLYSLFWAFEISALIDVVYHVTMYILADDAIGCSGVFKHEMLLYSLVKIPYELITFLLPIWVVLAVFRQRVKPTAYANSADDDDASWSSNLSDSTNPALRNVIPVHNWRRRYRPLQNASTVSSGTYRRLRTRSIDRRRISSRNNGVGSTSNTNPTTTSGGVAFRRVASAPTLATTRRASFNQNLSSPLYPIAEETSSSSSLQSSSSQSMLVGNRQ